MPLRHHLLELQGWFFLRVYFWNLSNTTVGFLSYTTVGFLSYTTVGFLYYTTVGFPQGSGGYWSGFPSPRWAVFHYWRAPPALMQQVVLDYILPVAGRIRSLTWPETRKPDLTWWVSVVFIFKIKYKWYTENLKLFDWAICCLTFWLWCANLFSISTSPDNQGLTFAYPLYLAINPNKSRWWSFH